MALTLIAFIVVAGLALLVLGPRLAASRHPVTAGSLRPTGGRRDFFGDGALEHP